ncbi:hypothetical protein [Paenibacillus sp. FSL H8-0537]|uniref:hypothetical protein n=1 Tax=Paenibacillus sp. FSL H8-0537 TaxID=2921399 RepID=UPI003101926C
MNYDDIYKLHLQLLSIYEKNEQSSSPFQQEINYYKKQLCMFTQDNIQRIFVLNQLIKIHEKTREVLVSSCANQYFSKDVAVDNNPRIEGICILKVH